MEITRQFTPGDLVLVPDVGVPCWINARKLSGRYIGCYDVSNNDFLLHYNLRVRLPRRSNNLILVKIAECTLLPFYKAPLLKIV